MEIVEKNQIEISGKLQGFRANKHADIDALELTNEKGTAKVNFPPHTAKAITTNELIAMNWNNELQVWHAEAKAEEKTLNSLTVQATDQSGRPGQWTIQPATQLYIIPEHVQDDSDADTIGAWPENGVMGTQLGPKSNGKPS
ncbi:hypothetical protein [Mucilaginibacter polytrichastri]|uniref:Uncharacterized protein n=1 Tax=Mucilaginibacter polytrichastri TaxID=1302689 RepID=A0A1Q5ZZV1_9SPHI|nr:hypothetical protein [Mucilaginibacter polytrichastri]OKS87272.1 hypothetical protein RG47T_2731 [Mucilaginibacter polytrichastri]